MKTKPIRVKSDEEFERLRDSIASQANDATIHFNLLKGLDASRKEYYLEMNESNTFWHLTFIAHRDAVISHLCLLYDKHSAALSLSRFLLTIKANRNLFSDAAFRKRLKDNPHVDTLAKGRHIDDAELDKEIASVSGLDPLVTKLWNLRDTVISHTAADKVIKDAPETWLPVQDIETLLSRAETITSKYSLLYRARQYGGIVGADDYKSTLRWLREALSHHQSEIDKQIKQVKRLTDRR